jgi:hypothetical protein
LITDALEAADLPAQIQGVGVIGSVGMPGHFDHFAVFALAPFGQKGETEWDSPNQEFAKLILQRVEQAAGVRPTLWRVPTRSGMRDFVDRGGERIAPYNLLLAPEPEWASGHRADEFTDEPNSLDSTAD